MRVSFFAWEANSAEDFDFGSAQKEGLEDP